MAVEEIYMDTARLGDIANQFNNFGDILKKVSNGLETAITVLEVTAFIGLVGGYAVKAFLEQVQPVIERASEKCLELGSDLAASVTAYQNGDAAGATRFY